MLFQTHGWDWVELILLAVLACAASQVKLKLPGTPQSISLAILPVTRGDRFPAPVPGLPGGRGGVLFDGSCRAAARKQSSRLSWSSLAPRSPLWALARSIDRPRTLSAWGCLSRSPSRWPPISWPSSGVSATLLGIESDISPWTVWKSNHFWTVPLYLLAPVGVVAARVILQVPVWVEIALRAVRRLLRRPLPEDLLLAARGTRNHAQALDMTHQRAIETLAEAIDTKDGTSAGHLQRVKKHARLLAEALGAARPTSGLWSWPRCCTTSARSACPTTSCASPRV